MGLAEVLDVTPPEGDETDWLVLASLALPDGRLAISDPIFMYQAEAIPLPPGDYAVLVRLRGHQGHRVVSRLRVARGTGGAVGAEVARVIVDSAQVGVGDLGRIAPAIERLEDDDYEARLSGAVSDDPVGVLHWDEETPMYRVGSGLGDGRYAVREVVSGSERIGIEVAFVEEIEDGLGTR